QTTAAVLSHPRERLAHSQAPSAILAKASVSLLNCRMTDRLLSAIDDRRDDLVALTADLIRFPTINPPGEAYTPCAEFIAARLEKAGFGTKLIRGEGTPGDSDRYPRTNVVARFDGRSPGP